MTSASLLFATVSTSRRRREPTLRAPASGARERLPTGFARVSPIGTGALDKNEGIRPKERGAAGSVPARPDSALVGVFAILRATRSCPRVGIRCAVSGQGSTPVAPVLYTPLVGALSGSYLGETVRV
jgi:hypothetical protein